MVEVEVRTAVVDDYAALHEIDQLGTWPSLPPEHAFDVDCHEYLVAVVDGQVWGFLQGHHDSTAWAACLVSPVPAQTWTCSTISYFTVHPEARAHGLGSALLREFMIRARAAGSQWMMLHPAECGTGRGLPPAMAALCARAGLRWVEPLAVHRRHSPTLMAAPLTDSPDHHFRAASHAPQTQARRRSTRTRRQPAYAAA
ncbi:GNAT family N-acetyltransferase [Kocuria sp. CPCC 205258]|jgi:GNAT superfamily N-acetyltransferase|uniref:GNAT family N-acetyltransferase n=1 Tax=Kocuria sp. CPCC 205258 TaxID=3073552 RepID=UPI0034D3A1FB